jgi:Ca-activated chloride channel family protein
MRFPAVIWLSNLKVQLGALALLLAGAGAFCMLERDCALLTPDQRGYRDFEQSDFEQAASSFADPMWMAVALYRSGDFAQSASLFAGFDTAEGAFNQGNALVMQGKYDAAVARYSRALQLRPGWEDAEVNRHIAAGRAAALEKKGGNMTDGQMGADDFVFEKGASPPSAGEEQIDGGQDTSDAELRSIWLRQVQTKPADFLRSKFAYQYATRDTEGN